MLKRYWFEFRKEGKLPPGLIIGCGITAYNEEDAFTILSSQVFSKYDLCEPIKIVEDVIINDLDQGHVVPNMLPPNKRGVWFPIGY